MVFSYQHLLISLSLVLVFEGLMPFLNPPSWRQFLESVMNRSDSAIRLFGLCSMLLGALMLYLIRMQANPF